MSFFSMFHSGYRTPFYPDNVPLEDEDTAELERFNRIADKFLRPATAIPACEGSDDIDGALLPESPSATATTAAAAATTTTEPSKDSTTPGDSSVSSLAGQLASTNVMPPTSGQSTPVEESSKQASGVSPERKESKSGDGTVAAHVHGRLSRALKKLTHSAQKVFSPSKEQPAPKVEKRGDVDALVKLMNKQRKTEIPQDRVEQYKLLPEEAIDELREELFFSSMERKMRRKQRRINEMYERREREYMDEMHESREREYMDERQYRHPRLFPTFPTWQRQYDSDSSVDDDTSPTGHGGLYADGPVPEGKFVITQRQKLLRLLILGGQKCKLGSPTVNRDRSKDPQQNEEFSVIPAMIEQGEGVEVVDLLKDISVKGRTPKQDGLLYGLAQCCRSKDLETKAAAYSAIQEMCRTPTQIFQLIRYIENLDKDSTGWGRGLRRALNKWYNSYENNPSYLAMHVTKYWSRHDWNHRDVFRLSHIKPVNEAIGFIVRYCVRDMAEAENYFLEDGYVGRTDLEKVHKYLKAVEEAKHTLDVSVALQLMKEHRLVREQLRTELLNEPEIWKAMLKDMPLFALIRNLGKMTSLKLFDDIEYQNLVVAKLSNNEAMRKARIHPIKILLAHHTYRNNRGDKGSLTWEFNHAILQALEKAFYASFGNVEPTNKRILIALDISGSMCGNIADLPITASEAATVMCMLTAKIEPNWDIVGFHSQLIDLNLLFKNSKKTLENLTACTHRLGFGMTDCSKPMLWALKRRKPYDAFIIYTDSETNTHRVPPHEALDKYRKEMGLPNAKMVVVGITTNDFTIARPNDLNMLDVCGFDPDTPDAISEFLKGSFE